MQRQGGTVNYLVTSVTCRDSPSQFIHLEFRHDLAPSLVSVTLVPVNDRTVRNQESRCREISFLQPRDYDSLVSALCTYLLIACVLSPTAQRLFLSLFCRFVPSNIHFPCPHFRDSLYPIFLVQQVNIC